jgi:hypothetical protein
LNKALWENHNNFIWYQDLCNAAFKIGLEFRRERPIYTFTFYQNLTFSMKAMLSCEQLSLSTAPAYKHRAKIKIVEQYIRD